MRKDWRSCFQGWRRRHRHKDDHHLPLLLLLCHRRHHHRLLLFGVEVDVGGVVLGGGGKHWGGTAVVVAAAVSYHEVTRLYYDEECPLFVVLVCRGCCWHPQHRDQKTPYEKWTLDYLFDLNNPELTRTAVVDGDDEVVAVGVVLGISVAAVVADGDDDDDDGGGG